MDMQADENADDESSMASEDMNNEPMEHIDDPTGWEFRTEGNYNIIMEDPATGLLYRLRKVPKEELCADRIASEAKRHDIERSLDFVKHVMIRLIGSDFVTPARVVSLPEESIYQISKKVPAEMSRNWRYMGKTMDALFPFAVRMKDLSALPKLNSFVDKLPVITVEIKPSRPFLCSWDEIKSGGNEFKKVCRQCIHQAFKVRRLGRWKPTGYCPVDLFSGDRERMQHALKQLIISPQGKFKIFKDRKTVFSHDIQNLSEAITQLFGGLSIYSHDDSRINEMLDLVIKALTHVPTWLEENDKNSNAVSSNHSDLNLSVERCDKSTYKPESELIYRAELPKGCLLYNLLQAQDMGHTNLKKTHDSYVKMMNHLEKHPEDRERWKLDGPYNNRSWSFLFKSTAKQEVDDGSLEYAVRQCKRQLAAIVAKHLSIIVSLQRLPDRMPTNQLTEDIIKDSKGRKFRFSVGVVDLDLYPIEHLEIDYKKWKTNLAWFCKVENIK